MKRPALKSLAALPTLLGSGCALAATPVTPPAAVGSGELLHVILVLGLVLALIAGLAWAAQRLRLGPKASGRHLRVVDALALGARERLMLVEVDGERVLIGIAGGRIERLHALGEGRQPQAFSTVLETAETDRGAA